MRLRILPDAEEEIESARQYFNLQAFALGDRFLDDLEETLARIASAPDRFPKLETLSDSEPYRRALLKIFHFAVIFEILEDSVLIVAVAHTNRKPNFWLPRRPPS